jgi:hypothetical protein
MKQIPTVWEFVLIAVASYRVWRLLAEDAILDRPRKWVLRLGDWEDGQAAPLAYRDKWGEFLICPWCLGAWLSLGIYLFWIWFPTETLIVCVPLALSATVAGFNALISFLTED